MRTPFAILACLCLAMFVVACAPQSAPQTPSPTAPVAVPPAPTQETPPPPPVVEQQTLDKSSWDGLPKDVSDILSKGVKQSATGYSYAYKRLENNRLAAVDANSLAVKERGTVTKATVGTPIKLTGEDYWIAYVIVDSSAKQATAYCTRGECGGRTTAAPRTVSYADWALTTPVSWLDNLRDVTKLGEETVTGRTAFKLSATANGQPITIWVDRFSGLPVQVQSGTTTYLYENVALGVTEKEVAP